MRKMQSDYECEIRTAMRGGDGQVRIIKMASDIPNVRLYARLELEKGCSIGVHEHNGETEIFHVLQGKALYTDNGEIYAIAAGDTTVTGSGESHGVANPYDEKLVLLATIVKG